MECSLLSDRWHPKRKAETGDLIGGLFTGRSGRTRSYAVSFEAAFFVPVCFLFQLSAFRQLPIFFSSFSFISVFHPSPRLWGGQAGFSLILSCHGFVKAVFLKKLHNLDNSMT